MRPQNAPLGFVSRLLFAVLLGSVCATCAAAQETPRLTLDTNPAVFTVLAGMNACGFNEDLQDSLPLRTEVRNEIAAAVAGAYPAEEALSRWCRFYMDHQQPDEARQLAQYVSLSLNLGEPPVLELKVKEADLPPDAVYVLGAVPLLQNLAITTSLEKIWQKHQAEYNSLIERYHTPVTNLIFSTDVYLKLQMSSYLGRSFIIYLDPMGAPGQVNSRNYGDDYYMVVTPGNNGIKLDQIRHTYLHYILDPMALKRMNAMNRLSPLLDTVKTAPLDDSYKNDITLLVTESAIRAIEARLTGGSKGPEAAKEAAVDRSMQEGFVLTRYFYEQLVKFEKDPAGLKDSFGIWLTDIYLPTEVKRARQLTWSKGSSPEVLRRNRPPSSLADQAERQYAAGNILGAQKLAQQAIDADVDAGRALFLLARISTQQGNMAEAKNYFGRALHSTNDPNILAWSHIYLGRISDLSQEREDAVAHYKAALEAGNISPEAKSAAERGVKEPFQPPKGKD